MAGIDAQDYEIHATYSDLYIICKEFIYSQALHKGVS